MRQCPKCSSEFVLTERRPNGDSQCEKCGYKDNTSKFKAIATPEPPLKWYPIEQPQTKIDLLQKKLQVAKDALGFYADHGAFVKLQIENIRNAIRHDEYCLQSIVKDTSYCIDTGSKARQALKELEEL